MEPPPVKEKKNIGHFGANLLVNLCISMVVTLIGAALVDMVYLLLDLFLDWQIALFISAVSTIMALFITGIEMLRD